MSIDASLIEQVHRIARGGWDSLDLANDDVAKLDKQIEAEELSEAHRQIRIVKAALATPAGAAFMTWLRTKTIEMPSSGRIGLTTAEAYALHAARQDGRAQIYLLIEGILRAEDLSGEQG